MGGERRDQVARETCCAGGAAAAVFGALGSEAVGCAADVGEVGAYVVMRDSRKYVLFPLGMLIYIYLIIHCG